MSPQLGNFIILASILMLTPILFLKKVRRSEVWLATVTPLASIIGSGFLISSALVILTTGKWAPLTMLVLVTIAYLLGGAMRFNIQYLEPMLTKTSSSKFTLKLEAISKPMLGIAYVISVAFYLKLLSIFTLRVFLIDSVIYENMITSAILIFIGLYGYVKGFKELEHLEKFAVNLKLIIIASMIVGNIFYNAFAEAAGNWFVLDKGHESFFQAFQKLLGILIIIQGFETSRYLGQRYRADTRIQSMKYAQIISGIIYVLYVSTVMIMFNSIDEVTETVVIDLCALVAPILPNLLLVAAIMSQFSASIADTVGSSGLISEASQKRISLNMGVVITVAIAIMLTWLTNIYQVIVIASKAFALYYMIQCTIAAKIAYSRRIYLQSSMFAALSILMLLVLTISVPVE